MIWHPDLEELITGPLRHEAQVVAITATGDRIGLDVEADALTITYSEDWAPYAQARMACAIPQDEEIIDALDGRKGCRLEIVAGYVFPDGKKELRTMGNLGLRTRNINRPSNVMRLDAGSDEALAQDRKKWNTIPIPMPGITEAVKRIAKDSVYPYVPQVNSIFSDWYFNNDLDDLEQRPEDDMWSILDEIMTRTDTRVWCDENRVWWVDERPLTSQYPAHFLKVGEAGTVIETDATLDRDEWYNSAAIVYRWKPKDATNDQVVVGYARLAAAGFAPEDAGWRTYTETRDRPIKQATADKRARRILRNLATRGRSLRLSAIAAYWLRPGDTITVQLVTGEPETHLVQSVTFDLVTGRMDLTTRQPDNYTITTGE